MDTGNQEWPQYRMFVMSSLRALRDGQKAQDITLRGIELAVARLQIRAGVWGLLGAAIPTIGAILFVTLSK